MIQVGNKVRSYDFPHDRECYVEGVVENLTEKEGCERYRIRVTRRIWAGEDITAPLNGCVYPPVNGTPALFGGVTNFVELV